jgi:hypothetical protein
MNLYRQTEYLRSHRQRPFTVLLLLVVALSTDHALTHIN